MFSFPLFERIKADVPEFEELTAFQAGMGRMSVRREGVTRRAEAAPRPLRHRQLLHDARRERARRPRIHRGRRCGVGEPGGGAGVSRVAGRRTAATRRLSAPR